MGVRLTKSGWVGIALIGLSVGTYLGYTHFVETRKFVPLDMPFVLDKARIQTPTFNLEGDQYYELSIRGDHASVRRPAGCKPEDSYMRTGNWMLWKNGILVSQGVNLYEFSYYSFSTGEYQLAIEVAPEVVGCANLSQPRLRLESSTHEHYEYLRYQLAVQWICAFIFSGGIALLFRSVAAAHRTPRELRVEDIIDAGTQAVHWRPLSQFRLKRQVNGLPSYGIVASLVLFALVLSIYVGQERLPSKGLYVRLVRPDAPKAGPWPEPLIIRIESKWTGRDSTYRWFLNSKEIKREELATELRKQLALRPKWIVYVEADTNSAYAVALDAIDTVRGLHATPVLLTPKTIEESKRAPQ